MALLPGAGTVLLFFMVDRAVGKGTVLDISGSKRHLYQNFWGKGRKRT